jgi:hypothetical protein
MIKAGAAHKFLDQQMNGCESQPVTRLTHIGAFESLQMTNRPLVRRSGLET